MHDIREPLVEGWPGRRFRKFMASNYQWFLRADLTAYEGQYIAIAHEAVVASGDDPGEVYERAKAACPGEEVVLWKVPVGEAFVFILTSHCVH
jgi:hypothetical protein